MTPRRRRQPAPKPASGRTAPADTTAAPADAPAPASSTSTSNVVPVPVHDAHPRVAMLAERLRIVPTGSVVPSPMNPRRTIDEGTLAELSASIRQDGILQPLLVRPAAPDLVVSGGPDGGEYFELIAGERRWRAACDAGLDEVPVIVREMTSIAVRRAMLVENVQRDSLTPLEEAAGYQSLLDADPTATADSVAGLVGRSRSWIYGRLQLRKLITDAAEQLAAGRITAAHGVELARLRPTDQARALGEAGRASVSGLQRWIGLRIRLPVPDGVVPIADTWEVRREDRGRDVLAPEAYHVLGGETAAAAASDPPGTPECGNAVDALVVLGERRGRRVRICPRGSRCEQHWGEYYRARRQQAARDKKYAAEMQRHERDQARRTAERERWDREIMPAIAAAVAARTWDVDDMIRVVLGELRHDHRGDNPPPGMEPLLECVWLTIVGDYWERGRVIAAARVLGLDIGDDGVLAAAAELAEAPGSRTQSSGTAQQA